MSIRPRFRIWSRLRWLGGRIRRHRWSISGCCVVLAGILGFLVNWTQAPQTLCTLPGVHSACRANGWGGVATPAEEATWEQARARSDGEGFRAYLSRYPTGAFAAAAQARLAGCRRIEAESWTAEKRTLPLYALVDQPSAGALAGPAAREARHVCRGYGEGEFRLDGASARISRSSCEAGRCEIEGEAVCAVRVRSVEPREECGPPAAGR